MKKKSYVVTFNNVKIKVEAYSKKQAKLKAGFKSGLGGNDLREFIKNKEVIIY